MVKYLKWYLLYIKLHKMAQKSLPILNKVNTSMVWYSTYYFRHYKWLSSQNLYLLYFFNKLFVYLDFFFFNLLWIKPHNTYLYNTNRKNSKAYYEKFRFFKPITSYLVSLNSKSIFISLYYKTSLETFQNLNKKKNLDPLNFFEKFDEKRRYRKLFFK